MMEEVTLFRGISVAKENGEEIIEGIRSRGLEVSKGTWWNFKMLDPEPIRRDLDQLMEMPDLTFDKFPIIEAGDGVCACGTALGAEYYAVRHNNYNGDGFPIVVEFQADLSDLVVDTRDFLCTAFQLHDQTQHSEREVQTRELAELFGGRIVKYFTKCFANDLQPYRIGLCNLAAYDLEVVRAHYLNKKIIGGRHKTEFASAFFERAPIAKERIVRVYSPRGYSPGEVFITLNDFLRR